MLLPIALLVVGLVLLAVEVYVVPGVGVVGVAGGLALVGGVVMAFVEIGFTGGLVAMGVTMGLVALLALAAWRSGALRRLVLGEALGRDEEADSRESEVRSRLLGKEGRAVTPLRPSGVAEIGGERIEVQTEGDFIAAGSHVRVVAMDRRRFFVRLAEDG